jgi:PhnB protein
MSTPTLDSYIFFDGQCAQAMRFYEGVLGATMQAMMTYAQSPVPPQAGQPGCGPGDADRIMHACLQLPNGRLLMASDSPAGMHKPMAGFGLALNYETADEARKVFDQLSAGGKVEMPMTQTFWADAFGMFTDRFGTPWMVGGGARPV